MAFERSAAELHAILTPLGQTAEGRALVRERLALEVAFVTLRRGDGQLARVRSDEAVLATRLRACGRGREATQLDTWLGRLAGELPASVTTPTRPTPVTVTPVSPVTPVTPVTPTVTPTPVTPPVTPVTPTPVTPVTPTPVTPTRDLLILPPTLPSQAALQAFAGRWSLVLIGGGEGAMSPDGQPCEFVGNLGGPTLEQFFTDLATAGITTSCLVLDFEFSLAWLDRVLPLLAPDAVVLACWSSARGQLMQVVLGGTRAPIDVLAGATALLRARWPEQWFDSPHALVSGGTLLRGADAVDWVLLDPKLADSNLAASHAVVRWVDARMVGAGKPIRRREVAWGLDGFVARARTLSPR
jgi:hypothetical protein